MSCRRRLGNLYAERMEAIHLICHWKYREFINNVSEIRLWVSYLQKMLMYTSNIDTAQPFDFHKPTWSSFVSVSIMNSLGNV